MAYQVIARKYRPQRFSDVVGQEHVTQTLGNAIQQKRIAHAYLFCGPRGTGKTTIARIFAKCLNCTGGPKLDFDDNDPRCQEIAEGRSIDVLEIDGASNRGIDEIRELRETVKYAPATSKFKVYIIDEVHMLTKEAFNALLKTLEEPPEHVKFMFATTEPEKVLPTILSRCQRYDLRRIPVALIVKHLAQICKEEKTDIDEAALFAIARGAEGCMRDAESALDQLISFCGNNIVESDVLSMFGLTAQNQVQDLTAAVLKGDSESVLREVNDLSKHGKDLSRLLSDLLNHFRNLLIFQVSRGDLNLLEVTETELASIKEQASMVTAEALTHVMEVLTEAEARLRDATSKKIFVEVSLLKAIQARQSVSIETVLQHLQKMRSGGDSSSTPPTPAAKPAAPAAVPAKAYSAAKAVTRSTATVATPAPAPEPAFLAETAAAAPEAEIDHHQLWRNVLEGLGRVSAFTRSCLQEAQPVSLLKHVLTIGFTPEFADRFELVNNPRTQTLLQTKLQELGHPNIQIKFARIEGPVPGYTPPSAAEPAVKPAKAQSAPTAPVAASSSAPAEAPAEPLSTEELKNDPLIRKALEIFKGQIVQIRI